MGVNNFIEAMTRNFPLERVHLNTNIREIQLSGKGQYSLITSDGQQLYFDHIVFAVDGQEILRLWHPKLLSVEEKEIIEHLKTTKNIAVLHSDVLLTTRISRSAYIYNVATSSHQHRHGDSTALKSCLTYNVNTLQGIPSSLFGPIFITLNPFIPPHPRFVQGIWEFTDPELRSETLHAQARLPSIQNKRGLSYGFRWTGRGFLEDSITAGLEIAVEHLGAKLPFEIDRQYPLDSSEPVSLNSGLKDHLVRVTLTLIRIYVQLLQLGLVLLGAIGTFFPGIRALFMRLNKIRVFKPV
ncbi:hypothetical protein EYZ11_006131 [Aspergillus tanneri]|nr:hypothetical protein EYZ11_006131 [Aspergillus tanneri]